jgi:hypothetical protein
MSIKNVNNIRDAIQSATRACPNKIAAAGLRVIWFNIRVETRTHASLAVMSSPFMTIQKILQDVR